MNNQDIFSVFVHLAKNAMNERQAALTPLPQNQQPERQAPPTPQSQAQHIYQNQPAMPQYQAAPTTTYQQPLQPPYQQPLQPPYQQAPPTPQPHDVLDYMQKMNLAGATFDIPQPRTSDDILGERYKAFYETGDNQNKTE